MTTDAEDLLSLTKDLFTEIETLKLGNTEIATQLRHIILEVGEIKVDRKTSGDKYQGLIQRLSVVETLVKTSEASIAAIEDRFDKVFEKLEDRFNEAIKGVEKRLEKKVDELFKDKKFWVQSLITCVLSIVGAIVAALVVAHYAGK